MSGTPGVSSCSKLSRFCSISGSLVLRKEPVAFPPGRFKLATKPSLTGSPDTTTTGIVEVACFAATAEGGPPVATSTFTRRCTNSAANAGSRSYSPRAQRYSMVTFWPSKKPASPRPLRNACNTSPVSSGERALMNPITGLVGCCARTENGQAAVAPPSNLMNSRRLIAAPEAQDKASHPNATRSKVKCVLLRDRLSVVRHYQPATTVLLIDPGYKEIDWSSTSVPHLCLTDLLADLPGEIAIDVNMRSAQRGLSLQEQLVSIVPIFFDSIPADCE